MSSRANADQEKKLEQPALKDQDQYPTKDVIYAHIGNAKPLWTSLFDYIHKNHSDFSEEWRYYQDGKAWLLKTTRKSKTIFWTTVSKDSFQITFYFTDKVEEAIRKSAISDELKEQFSSGKRYGKLRALTIAFRDELDIEYAKSLIAIRLKS